MKVKYSYPRNGYDPDRALAKEHLMLGKVYTVRHIKRGNFHTRYCLKEAPSLWFNSVLFKEV